MSEILILFVIIFACSFAIYYLTKVSTKETSFEKVLEEQRQSQISIVDVNLQRKKTKKRKKKTDEESIKKENSSRVTEEKTDKTFPNKEKEKEKDSKLGNKKELENISKFSDETLDKKANSAQKDRITANKSSQETFPISKKFVNSKVESKKVDKIQQNNILEHFCSSNNIKSIAKQEQNKSSKSKWGCNSEKIEKQEQSKLLKAKPNINSISVENHEQNKALKQKHIENLNNVEKREQNSSKGLKKNFEGSSVENHEKHGQNKPSKPKHVKDLNSIEKNEQIKPLKPNNSNNVTSLISKSNSFIEFNNKEVNQKMVEIKDNNYQKTKKTSLDLIDQLTKVNKINSSTVKDTKKKVVNTSSASVDISYSKLKHIIQMSQFTGSESQFLIEILLNKQVAGNTGGEWIEKGKVINPTSQLQRQLDEYKLNLNKECETNGTLLAKISSLRNDLNSERSRSKSFQEELKCSSALLQQKLNELSTAHKEQLLLQTNEIKKKINEEFQLNLAHKEEQLKAQNEINIQKYKSTLTDIERQLQQLQSAHQSSEMNCEKMRNVLSDTQLQLNNVNQEKEELLLTCKTYKQHLSNISEQTSEHELRLQTHLYEVQRKLKTSEASELQLISKINQLSEENERFEQQLRSFSQNQIKLEKIVIENKELDNQIQTYKSDIYNLHELLRNKELEIHQLKEENNEISACFRPVNNTNENGIHENSISPEEKICSCCKKNLTLKEEEEEDGPIVYETVGPLENGVKTRSVKKKEPSSHETSEEQIKIVEKIIEKVVHDPLTLEQLQETKRENEKLKITMESLVEEKRLLEESLRKDAPVVDQTKLVEDLQVENKSLAEKVNNYQRILSNTETLLKTLQKSVENEELTWREKLLKNEEAMGELLAEKEKLVSEVEQLRKSLWNIQESEKIETELNLMKEKLEVETKAKAKLKEELISIQEQLRSANSPQCDRYGTPDGTLQYQFELSQKDADSISSSQDQVSLQPEKKKKKNGRLASNE